MIKITSDLLTTAGTGSPSLVIALDLSSAFDTITRSKLLTRIKDVFGIMDIALQWVTSYLADRSNFVKFESACTCTMSSTAGVPQGSVLGPLLFAMYISPIQSVIDHYGVSHHSYADDTTLYVKREKDRSGACTNLEQCTVALSDWFTLNDMVLNPGKSEVMVVGTSQCESCS